MMERVLERVGSRNSMEDKTGQQGQLKRVFLIRIHLVRGLKDVKRDKRVGG